MRFISNKGRVKILPPHCTEEEYKSNVTARGQVVGPDDEVLLVLVLTLFSVSAHLFMARGVGPFVAGASSSVDCGHYSIIGFTLPGIFKYCQVSGVVFNVYFTELLRRLAIILKSKYVLNVRA